MNPIESIPLLKTTLRSIALMLVPVIAFLAILSAVALFAVPSANPSAKEERVTTPDGNAKDKSSDPTLTTPNTNATHLPGARAFGRPNKI